MINLVVAEASHLDLFKASDVFLGEPFARDAIQRALERNLGFAYTCFMGTEVLGCIGGYRLWEGVAEIWAWLSDAIKKYPVAFTRRVLHSLEYHQVKLNLHRYQMSARVDAPKAERWARTLGFQREGLMRRYGQDGSDYILMSRTF